MTHGDVGTVIGEDADAAGVDSGWDIADFETVAVDRDIVGLYIDGVGAGRTGQVMLQTPGTLRRDGRGYRVDEAATAVVAFGGQCGRGRPDERDEHERQHCEIL